MNKASTGNSNLIERSISSGGLTRWFLEYKPTSYPSGGGAPLVIVLHGGTESMNKIFRPARKLSTGQWLTLSDQHGFLVLAPNGVNPRNNDTKGNHQNWNDYRNLSPGIDDVAFLAALVNWAITNRAVNSSHIYVTGASNGGEMTFRMLIDRPNLFAAGTAFIANIPTNNVPNPTRPTPIMIVDGTADPLMPWKGGTVGKDRGQVRSALDTRDFWVQQVNHANTSAVMTQELPNYNTHDNCRILVDQYPAMTNAIVPNQSAPVWFYTMQGGGHNYPTHDSSRYESPILLRILGPPCKDASGVDLAWSFLSQF